MSPDRPLTVTGKASAQDLATVPARPQIGPRELSTGGPVLLEVQSAETSWKHTLGWEQRSERRGGACFLIVKTTFTGSFRVTERFPLTDAGWRRAWKALVMLDRDDAARALGALADRAGAGARNAELADLTAQSIGFISDATYIPGSGQVPDIASGRRVDVRFVADQVVFVPLATVPRVLARFSYPDVVGAAEADLADRVIPVRLGWLREHAARLTALIDELEGRWTADGRMADGALQAGER